MVSVSILLCLNRILPDDIISLLNKYMKKQIKRILSVTAVVVVVVGVVGGSYYLGFVKGNQQTRNITVEGVANVNQPGTGNFGTFWDVWNTIKSKYVYASSTSDNQNLIYGAVSGLVSSLNDPYTVFFPPKQANQFNQDISGQFGGIGAEIGMNDQKEITVIAPIKDTPAYKAGILSGDIIVKINGTSTAGLSVDEAVNQIRGDAGTKVALTIFRDGWSDTKDIEITREVINVPTIDFKMVNTSGKEDTNGSIAYIRMYNFYEQSPYLFYQAALQATNNNAKAMVLDLRDNPGGYLDAAVSVAGWFVDKGKTVVTEAFRDSGNNQTFTSNGPSVFDKIPVVVIINKGSASASEILAGALKESNDSTIVGEKSFGKGTVQELDPLPDGSMLKMTIAHWLTPKGNQIDKNGITPDISIAMPTSTSTALKSSYDNDLNTDSVFQKAVQIIDQKL